MADNEIEVHPLAAVWPMLREPDLRRLAEDIAENGQLHPILLDGDGRVLDGRNRLAACRIAGVEPKFETYDGDPASLVLSAEQRRHQTTGQYAMGTAVILATVGKRRNGRWERGSVPEGSTESRNTWSDAMMRAGIIIDHAPDLTQQVVAGEVALDAAYREASEAREHSRLRIGLPDDLGALVDAGELPLNEALRRAALPDTYQARVAAGTVSLSEAEHLAARDQKEYDDATRRQLGWLGAFLAGWDCASGLRDNPRRAELLEQMDPYDRERFLVIEKTLEKASVE